ncbi:hypothetical protein BHM03_00051215 [Ensete ventricosum]|nr:hypothetical protein BHM03_00051215 [Ensete ventricosum]
MPLSLYFPFYSSAHLPVRLPPRTGVIWSLRSYPPPVAASEHFVFPADEANHVAPYIHVGTPLVNVDIFRARTNPCASPRGVDAMGEIPGFLRGCASTTTAASVHVTLTRASHPTPAIGPHSLPPFAFHVIRPRGRSRFLCGVGCAHRLIFCDYLWRWLVDGNRRWAFVEEAERHRQPRTGGRRWGRRIHTHRYPILAHVSSCGRAPPLDMAVGQGMGGCSRS